MRSRRVLGAAFAALLLVLACGGDDAGGEGEVTLRLWSYEATGDDSFGDALLEEFEEAHPNIDIDVTQYPSDQFDVKVETAIAAGEPPDIVLVFGPDWMREGLLLPLDDMVAEHDIDLSTFNQGIVEGPGDFSCAWEDTLYCLGSHLGAVVMFYNKEMLDAAGVEHPEAWPPMTVDEFADAACRLRDEEAGVWGAAFDGGMVPNQVMFSPDGHVVEGYVNSPASVRVFDTLAGVIREGCAPSANIIDPWEQGTDFFARGELAMAVTDFEALVEIEAADVDYGITAVPTPSGVEPTFPVWTDSLGVLASSEHPDEAKEFIAFLATEGQRLRVEVQGALPLSSAVAEDLDWAQGIPGRLDGLEVVVHAQPPIWIPEDLSGPFNDAWFQMVGGEESAQDALDEAASKMQEDLDQAWANWEEQGEQVEQEEQG